MTALRASNHAEDLQQAGRALVKERDSLQKSRDEASTLLSKEIKTVEELSFSLEEERKAAEQARDEAETVRTENLDLRKEIEFLRVELKGKDAKIVECASYFGWSGRIELMDELTANPSMKFVAAKERAEFEEYYKDKPCPDEGITLEASGDEEEDDAQSSGKPLDGEGGSTEGVAPVDMAVDVGGE